MKLRCIDTILLIATVNHLEIVEIIYFHMAMERGFPKEIYMFLSCCLNIISVNYDAWKWEVVDFISAVKRHCTDWYEI